MMERDDDADVAASFLLEHILLHTADPTIPRLRPPQQATKKGKQRAENGDQRAVHVLTRI